MTHEVYRSKDVSRQASGEQDMRRGPLEAFAHAKRFIAIHARARRAPLCDITALEGEGCVA